MKERGIIFTGESVRAILDGRKTQTRRVCLGAREQSTAHDWHPSRCPYGVPGDRLYVKETWAQSEATAGIVYRADAETVEGVYKWRSSMFMPRWASRITLEVVAVRVERLQEIIEADAKAEGVTPFEYDPEGDCWTDSKDVHRSAFEYLWDSINRERAPWASNPWVFVISFRRCE